MDIEGFEASWPPGRPWNTTHTSCAPWRPGSWAKRPEAIGRMQELMPRPQRLNVEKRHRPDLLIGSRTAARPERVGYLSVVLDAHGDVA